MCLQPEKLVSVICIGKIIRNPATGTQRIDDINTTYSISFHRSRHKFFFDMPCNGWPSIAYALLFYITDFNSIFYVYSELIIPFFMSTIN
jgi:hypothetical protein